MLQAAYLLIDFLRRSVNYLYSLCLVVAWWGKREKAMVFYASNEVEWKSVHRCFVR